MQFKFLSTKEWNKVNKRTFLLRKTRSTGEDLRNGALYGASVIPEGDITYLFISHEIDVIAGAIERHIATDACVVSNKNGVVLGRLLA